MSDNIIAFHAKEQHKYEERCSFCKTPANTLKLQGKHLVASTHQPGVFICEACLQHAKKRLGEESSRDR